MKTDISPSHPIGHCQSKTQKAQPLLKARKRYSVND